MGNFKQYIAKKETEGLTSAEINTIAVLSLELLIVSWQKVTKKTISFGDVSMVLTRMAYLLTAKVVEKSSQIIKPSNN